LVLRREQNRHAPRLGPGFPFSLVGLFSEKLGKWDLEKDISDWDLRIKKWHSNCIRFYVENTGNRNFAMLLFHMYARTLLSERLYSHRNILCLKNTQSTWCDTTLSHSHRQAHEWQYFFLLFVYVNFFTACVAVVGTRSWLPHASHLMIIKVEKNHAPIHTSTDTPTSSDFSKNPTYVPLFFQGPTYSLFFKKSICALSQKSPV